MPTKDYEASAEAVGHILADQPKLIGEFVEGIEAKEKTAASCPTIALMLLQLDAEDTIDVAGWPEPNKKQEDIPEGSNEMPDRYKEKVNNRTITKSWYEETFLTMLPQYQATKKRIDWLRKATNRKRDNSDLPQEIAVIPYVQAVNELKADSARLQYAVEQLFRRAVRVVRQIAAIHEHCPGVTCSLMTVSDQDGNESVVRGQGVVLLEAKGEPSEVRTIGELLQYQPEIAAANGGTIAALKTSGARGTSEGNDDEKRIVKFDDFVSAVGNAVQYMDAQMENDDAKKQFRAALSRHLGIASKRQAKDDTAILTLGDFFVAYREEIWGSIEARYNRLKSAEQDTAEAEADPELAKVLAS